MSDDKFKINLVTFRENTKNNKLLYNLKFIQIFPEITYTLNLDTK